MLFSSSRQSRILHLLIVDILNKNIFFLDRPFSPVFYLFVLCDMKFGRRNEDPRMRRKKIKGSSYFKHPGLFV